MLFIVSKKRGAVRAIFSDGIRGERWADLREIHWLVTTRQNTHERIIIGGGDRIKFMIMTPRTGERESQHPAPNGVDAIIDDEIWRLNITFKTPSHSQKAEGA